MEYREQVLWRWIGADLALEVGLASSVPLVSDAFEVVSTCRITVRYGEGCAGTHSHCVISRKDNPSCDYFVGFHVR